MNLFKDVKLGEAISTKKLSIQGRTDIFPVYRIPIDNLIYNKKNGRIATYVSQFIDEGNEFPSDDLVAFNNIIERYIEQSNPEALRKTKANIRIMSQTEPAVVLSNGIVLDGNRRFTSLRQLYREGAGAEFAYLEAVILDSEVYTDKDIKRLELNLQHAVESRVDYNPIDRLVDIYRDLIEDGGSFSPNEYATETQLSLRKVNEEIEISKLMIEYLDYIGQPFKFYIARDQKIDGPIREIHKILRSNEINKDRLDDIKEYLFLNILSLDGDITRRIRELKAVFSDKKLSSKILDEMEESQVLDDANDFFEEGKNHQVTSSPESNDFKFDKNIKQNVVKLTESYVESNKLSKARNQPNEILDKAYRVLSEVDKDAVQRMDSEALKQFHSILEKISDYVEELRTL